MLTSPANDLINMTQGSLKMDLGGFEWQGLMEGFVWTTLLRPWGHVRWGYKSTKALCLNAHLL